LQGRIRYHEHVIDDTNIGVLREKIDKIDKELLELLSNRIQVVHQVGEIKREKGIGVFDPNREEKLLQELVQVAPGSFDAEAIRNIFSAIVAECRRLEGVEMQKS